MYRNIGVSAQCVPAKPRHESFNPNFPEFGYLFLRDYIRISTQRYIIPLSFGPRDF